MKILLESEIEAHMCLPKENKDFVVHIEVPTEKVEFYMRNGDVALGTENPTLITALVFEAQSLETGFEEGKEKVIQILNAFTVVTSSTFKYRKSLRLVDWSEGRIERGYKVTKPFPGHELPYEHLAPAFVFSAIRIWASQNSDVLQRAVHWFSSGIAARLSEDQFQFFWFMLELIAEHQKPSAKVHDACTTCGSPLYCESCQEHPMHRPFNKQSIETLIKNSLGDDGDQTTCKRLFKVRNMLMHGSKKKDIEKEIGTDLVSAVNELASIARKLLFELIKMSVPAMGTNDNLPSLEIKDYSHRVLQLTVNMASGPFEPDYHNLRNCCPL